MKRKKTISKHDLIRTLKAHRLKLDQLYQLLYIQQNELVQYVDFKGETKDFEKWLKEKYERQQSERSEGGGNSSDIEE